MTQINPFIGAVVNSTSVQRAQAAEKNAHVQRAQLRAKDSAASTDQFEHQVESSEGLSPIHDENSRQPQNRKPKQPPRKSPATPPAEGDGVEAPAHIDVKV